MISNDQKKFNLVIIIFYDGAIANAASDLSAFFVKSSVVCSLFRADAASDRAEERGAYCKIFNDSHIVVLGRQGLVNNMKNDGLAALTSR